MIDRVGNITNLSKPVSRLVLGSTILSPPDRKNAFALLDEHVKLGGNAVETAHQYGEGDCERMIGAWMKDRSARDQFVVITKGGHPFDGRSRLMEGCVRADLEESLRRLQTDYVDMFMLHRDDPDKPVEEIVDLLNVLHKEGKVRAFGGSNWTPQRIDAANEYAKATNQIPFSVCSPHFSLAVPHRQPWHGCLPLMRSDLPWYRKHNIGVIAWSSLARGFFTGLYSPEHPDADGVVEAWFTKDNFARLKRAQDLAKQKGTTPTAIALAYVLSQQFKPFAAVGSRTIEELRDSFSAFKIELTEKELHWLETSDN